MLAPVRSAIACAQPATAAACRCRWPIERPPLPGAAWKKRKVAASIASWAIALRPTSVTAARMLRARSGRAQAAELA